MKCREATLAGRRRGGSFKLPLESIRGLNEPPRPRLSMERGYFLMARPPLLCQGGESAPPKRSANAYTSQACARSCILMPLRGWNSILRNHRNVVGGSMNTLETLKSTELDVSAIRRDFPGLHQSVHGNPLVYLDNAATTQKPNAVIEALDRFYRTDCSNV